MSLQGQYSRVILWVKVALPLLAILLLSTLFLFSRTPDPERAIPFADVDVEDLANRQQLSRPRFSGTLDDGREVQLIAQTAMPLMDATNRMQAEQVEARLELSDTEFVLLSADGSLVDLDGDVAELIDQVVVTSSRGYRMTTDRLFVALDRLDLTSPGEVEIDGAEMSLRAGSMQMTGAEGAQVLSFNGGVRVIYQPEG